MGFDIGEKVRLRSLTPYDNDAENLVDLGSDDIGRVFQVDDVDLGSPSGEYYLLAPGGDQGWVMSQDVEAAIEDGTQPDPVPVLVGIAPGFVADLSFVRYLLSLDLSPEVSVAVLRAAL